MKHTLQLLALVMLTAACQTTSPRPPVRADIPTRSGQPLFRTAATLEKDTSLTELLATDAVPMDELADVFLDTNSLPKEFTNDGRYWVTLCSNGTYACKLQRSDNGQRSWHDVRGMEEALMTGDRWCLSLSDKEHSIGSEYRIKLRKRY